MSKNSWIGRVSRGEWSAGAGVLSLTGAVGSAIWQQTSMRWPFSPGAWFVAVTAVVAVALVGYSYVSMRSIDRLPVPAQRGVDDVGWRWSSSPTSAANSPAAARIGFRVTVIESIGRKSPVATAMTPANTEGGARRPLANAPRASEPDAWVQHLSVAGNTDFDVAFDGQIDGQIDNEIDNEIESIGPVDLVQPTDVDLVHSVASASKVAKRKSRDTPIAVAPTGMKRPAGNERAGGPPVQRRARREAMASDAAAVARSQRSTSSGDGLDDLAQRLQQGVLPPRRRTVDSDARVDAGPRRIVRDTPGLFACPEATRD